MNYTRQILLLVPLLLLFLSCASKEIDKPGVIPQVPSAPVASEKKEPWQQEWDKTLAMARKEEKVVVYSTAGSAVRNAIVPAFREKTGISLEMVIGTGAEVSQKLLSERRASLFAVDIYTGGSTTIFGSFKPGGVLDPIEPALILPEVLDPAKWFEGSLPWADSDRRLVLYFTANPERGVAINTSEVKKGELTSYYDLLDKKWKGRISIKDPSTPGRTQTWFGLLTTETLNLEYMRALAMQEPFITRNERLQMEWLAHGKMPVAIGLSPETILELSKAGVPVEEIILKGEALRLSSGSGGHVTLINKAPHPHAAKVYINWLLSREGQTIYARAGGAQSARVDAPTDHLHPYQIREENVKYFFSTKEVLGKESLEKLKVEWGKNAAEIFGHLNR